MTEAKFSFISDATGGDKFTVVSFTGNEAISSLYQYELEIKSPLAAATNLDDLLDSPARFVTETNGQEYPVYGVLSSIDEIRTVQGYVYYQAVLVPQLWRLSIYKTNEIYCEKDQTVDEIIETVLESAGFISGADYDLSGLDDRDFLKRDYRCQFGESDFDFISRLMENEGIFYYFDHSGDAEKIIFINDLNYLYLPHPGLIFDVAAQTSRQHNSVNAWSCRKQRLASSVTIRDFNPDQPSLDISHTIPIDQMGQGTEYLYGDNICDAEEAEYLSNIRAEEHLCQKTRYYGESSVTRLKSGYLFGLGGHPNENYNGVEYLTVEVSHKGMHLDMSLSGGWGLSKSKSKPQYRNSFVAIEASEQYRPARVTAKPRFYGTMTAFVYAEAATMKAEIDECGRYRVHLPFDRSDGTLLSTDPHRKASTWIRMAQPYVGQEQGMYYPLTGGTEVLLTFINGDPDQPIISGAVPNASQPSLLSSETNFQRTITTQPSQTITGNTHKISRNSARLARTTEPPPAMLPSGANPKSDKHSSLSAAGYVPTGPMDDGVNIAVKEFINAGDQQSDLETRDPTRSMLPPWTGDDPKDPTTPGSFQEDLINFKFYDEEFKARDMNPDDRIDDADNISDVKFERLTDKQKGLVLAQEALESASTDRSGGDEYVYANRRTFAYPQHERVYFIGTFHEDFHVKDDFITNYGTDAAPAYRSWTGVKEQFNFPAPGLSYGQAIDPENDNTDADPCKDDDTIVNPSGIRGVSEDKRWGDQMNYAWGRSFNWAGGPVLLDDEGKNGSFATYNYGNSYTENLLTESGGTSEDLLDTSKLHADDYTGFEEFKDKGLASASVEKTWGSVYSYHNGYAADVHEGNSLSKTYGNTWEEYYGTTDSTYHGFIHEYTMAGKAEFNLAACSAISLAESFELYGGLKQEINLAWAGEFFIGSTLDFYLAAKQEIGFSLNFELFYAPKFGISGGPAINKAFLDLEPKDTEIQDIKLRLKKAGALIEKAGIELKSGELEIGGMGLTLFS